MPMKKQTGIAAGLLSLSLVLSGCMFGGEQGIEEIDPPKEVTYVEDGKGLNNTNTSTTTENSNASSMDEENQAVEVMRELYLVDSNGYVVPQSLPLPTPDSRAVTKQTLEYLVKGGPVTNLLPNGFTAILPEGTEVLGLNLEEDGTLVADFSKEFANYRPEDELKILQSVTWTATQFKNVKRVKIRINGYEQDVMPVNGTPISDGTSRADGINITTGDAINLVNSSSVTLYYFAQHGDNEYFVPVTTQIENKGEDTLTATVNALINGPAYGTNLLSDFHPDAKLVGLPVYEDGMVTLNFNEMILQDSEMASIADSVLNSLVLTLTEQEGIESVSINVNGYTQVTSESGEVIAEPVTRPEKVNIGSF